MCFATLGVLNFCAIFQSAATILKIVLALYQGRAWEFESRSPHQQISLFDSLSCGQTLLVVFWTIRGQLIYSLRVMSEFENPIARKLAKSGAWHEPTKIFLAKCARGRVLPVRCYGLLQNMLYMIPGSIFLCLIPVIVQSCALRESSAQSIQKTITSETPQEVFVLSKLGEPTYPPMALVAHVQGDVDLMLAIRRDGSVESAVPVSGHPILIQAAIDSALRSQFECRGCGDAVTSYALRYKFQVTSPPGDPCGAHNGMQPPPAEVDPSRHQVTVLDWAVTICDPGLRKVRSAKCLFLWRCGRRESW